MTRIIPLRMSPTSWSVITPHQYEGEKNMHYFTLKNGGENAHIILLCGAITSRDCIKWDGEELEEWHMPQWTIFVL